jgi:hypothetical protein
MYPVAFLVALVATLASLIAWSEIQWAERRSKRESTGPRVSNSERCHWPYFVDDGERCHANWEWQAWQGRGSFTVTSTTTLGDATADTLTLHDWRPIIMGITGEGVFASLPRTKARVRVTGIDPGEFRVGDKLRVCNLNATEAEFIGEHTDSTAANRFDDLDGTLRVLILSPNLCANFVRGCERWVPHVDGTRVPVECP